MKQKTLQEQYNLIKEGKGNTDAFIKSAKRQFPAQIRNSAGLTETVNSLKHNHIISENVWGIATESDKTPDWFSIFDKNMKIIAEEAKAVEKKTSQEVEDIQSSGYDYSDEKNIDNIYGEEFLTGYYAEMKDPKNIDKTVEELKDIVAKNLTKDKLYYVKDGQFGVKGLGYEEKEMEEVSGKYKSSGYSDKLKKSENKDVLVKESLGEAAKPDFLDLDGDGDKEETMKKAAKDKNKKMKKESIDTKISEIEKAGKLTTLEAQIDALSEVIDSKNNRIDMVSEDENLSGLVDNKKMKEMQKEIKLLEKRKAGMEKMYEKMCGKAYAKSEVIDEDSVNEIGMFNDPRMSSGRFDHLTSSGNDEPSEEYMEVKLEAEDRVDAGEEVRDVVKDYPKFEEMLLQDLGGKYGI
jgi:ribosomal protein L20A (L18A)